MNEEYKSKEQLISELIELRQRIAELEAFETERRRIEENFQLIVESALNAIVKVNQRGEIIFINPQTEKLFGYNRQELIEQPVEILIPERFRSKHREYFRGFLANPVARQLGAGRYLFALHKDGSEFPVEIGLNPIKTENGIVVLGSIIDITEHKRVEEALKNSEVHYRRLFETAKDGILILDANTGEIIDANPFIEHMLGYSHAELIGRTLREIDSFRDIAASNLAFQELRSKEYIRYTDLPLETKGGQRRHAELVSNVYTLDDTTVIQCNLRDITEGKRNERLLTEQAHLLDLSKDTIFARDVHDRITYWNKGAVHTYGYARNESLGKVTHELLQTVFSEPLESINEKLYRDGHWSGELIHTRKDGSKLVDMSRWALDRDAQGNPVAILETNTDITERKLAEDRLQKVNEELSGLVTTLQSRDREMTLINRLNDLIQACKTQEEAYPVIALTLGELFSGQQGCLAIFHASGQYLETVARWGNETLVETVFALEKCWALRRGQPQGVVDPLAGVLCRHFVHTPETGYLCLPLVVQGETLGLLYITTPTTSKGEYLASRYQLAETVAEAIKLSLSNLRLREILHEQANRDTLTGLFNRRYLLDTLPRELHRALRINTPLCLAMLDIDHFKLFNDTYGHGVCDVLLHELGQVLSENLRKSDIACRYGGEEFVIVLIDSPLEEAQQRFEQIRLLIERMQIRHGNKLLGTMTVSLGMAWAPEHGSTANVLLRSADYAMYAAKHAGRNCIVLYQGSE